MNRFILRTSTKGYYTKLSKSSSLLKNNNNNKIQFYKSKRYASTNCNSKKTYYNKIRSLHWTGQKKKLKKDFDINIDFFSAPYTFLKTFLYIELSSLLVFLIQNTSITPNLITILYALLGIFGGIFLGSGSENLILTGILIFFFKGVLDWTDGLIARLRKET